MSSITFLLYLLHSRYVEEVYFKIKRARASVPRGRCITAAGPHTGRSTAQRQRISLPTVLGAETPADARVAESNQIIVRLFWHQWAWLDAFDQLSRLYSVLTPSSPSPSSSSPPSSPLSSSSLSSSKSPCAPSYRQM